MMAKRIKTLVITGYGINCEKEMGVACEMAGAEVTYLHAQRLFDRKCPWEGFQLVAFPGGFSFGDELGAAKAFANRIAFSALDLRHNLQAFADRGNCILGICNGFQLLVKLGLLPGGSGFNQTASLTYNSSSRFECRWATHKVCSSPCIFTKDLESLYLPVRHGEGRFIAPPSQLSALEDKKQIVLKYTDEEGNIASDFPYNPNGSEHSIAGICDPTGRIFGMMAHPEAAIHFTNSPRWTRSKEDLKRRQQPLPIHGEGFSLFANAINFLRKVE